MASAARAGLAIGGAAVGGLLFGGVGAAVGFTAGNFLGGILFGDQVEGQTIEGPRLGDLSIAVSTLGKGIPIPFGTVPVPGNIIWGADIEEVAREDIIEAPGGGKGQPRQPSTTQVSFEYFLNFAVSFGEGPVELIRRIWLNEILVVDLSDENPQGRLFRYGQDKYRFYFGDEEQLPDPLIESFEGVGNVSAYRGQVVVVFDGLPLRDFGNRVPNLIKAEVVENKSVTLTREDAGIAGAHARDAQALDLHAPFLISTDLLGQCLKINRITNDVVYDEELDDNADFIAEKTAQGVDQNVDGSIGRPFVDPTNGDIYMSPEGTTGQGGGFAVMDTDFNFILYQHNGTFGAPRNGRVIPMGGRRYVVQLTGLLAVDILVRQWIADVNDPLNPRGTLGSQTDSEIATGVNWEDFGYDPTNAKDSDGGRCWIVGNDGSDNPHIVTVSPIGVIGTITNLTISSTVPTGSEVRGVAYDLNTDSLILVCLSTVFKLDPTTFAVIDEVGTAGNPASDGGAVGHISGFTDNTMNNQDTLQGLLHTIPIVTNFLRVETIGMTVLDRVLNTAFSPSGDWDEGPTWDPVIPALWGTDGSFQKYFFDKYAVGNTTLAAILSNISSRVGLGAADIDTTGVTDVVRGYLIQDPTTGRAAIQPLQQAFFFDGAEIDFKLTFKSRDGASSSTVTSADLAVTVEGDTDRGKFKETRRQEVEVPRRVTVSFLDVDNDYAVATQLDQRILKSPGENLDGVTQSRHEAVINLPVVFNDQEGREVAAKAMDSAWVERASIEFKLPPKFQLFDPTDVITIDRTSPFGLQSSVDVRIVDVEMGDGGVIQVRALFQDPAIYSPNVTASPGKKNKAPAIKFPTGTQEFLLNLPALRGSVDDEGPAFFAGAPKFLGVNASWNGAILFGAVNSESALQEAATVTVQTDWGTLRTTLTTGPRRSGFRYTVFDEESTVDVRVDTGAALSSSTDVGVLGGANLAHIPSTGEVFGYVNATLIGDDTYRLGRLLRGRWGTEGFITATVAKNTKIVFIDQSRMSKFSNINELGLSRFYEVATIGDDVNPPTNQNFTNIAATLLPLGPAQVEMIRNLAGDQIITFVRRPRRDNEWLDGVDVPLVEESEEYELDVLERDDNYPETVLRVTGDGVDGSTVADDLSFRNFTEAQSIFGSQAEIDTAQSQFGGASFLFNPSGSVDPSASFVSWPDSNAWNFAGGDFTAECWVRFADLTSNEQVWMSHFLNTGNNRSWIFARSGSNIRLQYSTTGADLFTVDRAFTWAIDTWYHVAMSRKADFLRMFVDGVQVGDREDLSGVTFFDATTVFYLGKIRASGTDDFPLDGWIDDARITLGVGRYDGNFNPPQRAQPTSAASTVVRAFAGLTAPTVTYTVAQQTTDFGGIEKDVLVDVYQISQSAGRGRSRLVRLKG